MQRRDFSRSLLAAGTTAVGAAAGLTLTPALAQRAALQEGNHYVRLPAPAPVQAPAGQIEVVEFFAYTCGFCYQFEPMLKAWEQKKPADVSLRRVPVGFSREFVPMQQLFFTLEAMGQIDALHEKIFQAIHRDREPLITPPVILEWVVKQGVDRARYSEIATSEAIGRKIADAIRLHDAYGVEGTPSLGVAGRYCIKGQGAQTLVIADALIAEVRKA